MKIESIKTKSGEIISLGNLTVLVGPNNVGKSQTLRDIHTKMINKSSPLVIIHEIEIQNPRSINDVLDDLDTFADPNNLENKIVRGINSNLTGGEQVAVPFKNWELRFKNVTPAMGDQRSIDINEFLPTIGRFHVAYLNAESRLTVVKTSPAHDQYTQPPGNLLQGLYIRKEIEVKLKKAFNDIFGMEILLDYCGLTTLNLRVAKHFDEIPLDPRDAYHIFKKHSKIDDQGDGYRSFAGVILSLLLSERRIILLDEPEAFLHPAQARGLGLWIAEHARSISGQIVVATHNSSFLQGILGSNEPVNIFRLNREGDNTHFNRITSEATRSLVKSPLLSSQRVLDAIFYKGVVVCEGDADRAVYQTVASKEFENQEILFIHAHNKQVIHKVVDLLREAQISVSAVVDIDILNSNDDLKVLLESFIFENELFDHILSYILNLRNEIANEINKTDDQTILKNIETEIKTFLSELKNGDHKLSGARGALNRLRSATTNWKAIKENGLEALSSETKNNASDLIEQAKKRGLFIVPVGELESWISLGTRKKIIGS